MTTPDRTDDNIKAERIARLEEHVAHQANTIEELSDQLAEQWRVVEQLRAKLDVLTERFLTLEAGSLEASRPLPVPRIIERQGRNNRPACFRRRAVRYP